MTYSFLGAHPSTVSPGHIRSLFQMFKSPANIYLFLFWGKRCQGAVYRNQPVCPFVQMSCKHKSSLTDEHILMKLHSHSSQPEGVHEGGLSRFKLFQGR